MGLGASPLARYILNLSEIHVMGLAWFFTRYLTQGRFECPLLMMDDPAQEMDQTTFRDLCRLWETLLRLHKAQKIPLNLIVMLHQESRALDAARATGGIICTLSWGTSQDQDNLSQMKLLSDGFHPLRPTTEKL